jgi:hypothetical protein
MILAKISAYDEVLGAVQRVFRVVAEDAGQGLELVAADPSIHPDWRLTVETARPAKEWDTPRIDRWETLSD